MWPHFRSAWRICSVCLVQRGCSSNILPSRGLGLHGATVPASSLVPAALEHSEPQRAGNRKRLLVGMGGEEGGAEEAGGGGGRTRPRVELPPSSHGEQRPAVTAISAAEPIRRRALHAPPHLAARRLHSSPRGAAFTHRETRTQLMQRRDALQHVPPSLCTLIQGRHKQSGRERN